MLWLLILFGALQAATLKIEAAEGSLLVYVDGSQLGSTPIVLELDDGRHPLEFKREDWQVASVRYGLLVSGQTKGKMVVDWETEEVALVWAEDVVAAREAEKARIEAEKQAEQDRIDFERQLEEEARFAQEERERAAEEQRRILAEEARQAAAKERYMPHREVGVAAMKAGDRRTALHAFRAARDAGDEDKRIVALVAKLEGEMASLRVKVSGARYGVPLELTVDTDEAEPFGPSGESRGRWTFDDVPAGVPVTLRVSGPGYPTAVVPVPPLEAGTRGDASAKLEYLGTATLVLTDYPDAIRVTVRDPATEHSPREAGELAVTAGSLEVELDGPSGVRTLAIELADGATEQLAVKDQMPGAMVLEGLPAGTTLSFVTAPEGAALSKPGTARDDVDAVQHGVGISGPLRLEGLIPGDYELAMDHPVLGRATMRFSPLPGETSTLAILWETMSQAAQVKSARQDWEQRLAASQEVPKPMKLSLASGGATLAAAAATAVAGASYLGSRADLQRKENALDAALADDDGQTAWDLYEVKVGLQQSMRTTGAISLGGLGLTAAGAGVSIVLFGRGRQLKKPVEDWDLWSIETVAGPQLTLPDLPVPEPSNAEEE